MAKWKPLWITLVGLASALVVGWLAGYFSSEETSRADQVRIAGWWLQVLGIFTVAVGLKRTRALFGLPSIKERLVDLLKQFPKIPERREVIEGTLHVEDKGELFSARGTVGPKPSASVEERLGALEEKYKQLNQELIEARNEVKAEAQRLEEAVQQEQRERDEADAAIREQLESFSVGGLHLESMGLVWLLLGITCATLPAEIATLWAALN